MQRITSFEDDKNLVSVLNAVYPIDVTKIRKLRDWIGYVYHIDCVRGAYILKIYRSFHSEYALNSIGIIKYLTERKYPVAHIIDTIAREPYIQIGTPNGNSIAILYKRISGEEPTPETDLQEIAEQTGILHSLMAQYKGEIAKRGREYYIDRYLTILQNIKFPESKLSDLKAYANELWNRFDLSIKGFCHGDLHCGNMLKDDNGLYWLFDFDAACCSHPTIDIAIMSDDTDYFSFQPEDFDKTTRKLDRFLSSYEKTRSMTIGDYDRKSVYDFIAIRHYDIQATITSCQGYSINNLENQHRWLMNWRNLCERRLKL